MSVQATVTPEALRASGALLPMPIAPMFHGIPLDFVGIIVQLVEDFASLGLTCKLLFDICAQTHFHRRWRNPPPDDGLISELCTRSEFSTHKMCLFWRSLLQKYEEDMKCKFNRFEWTERLLNIKFDSTEEFLADLSELDIRSGLPHLLEHLNGKGKLETVAGDVLKSFNAKVDTILSGFDQDISLANICRKRNSDSTMTVHQALLKEANSLSGEEKKNVRPLMKKVADMVSRLYLEAELLRLKN